MSSTATPRTTRSSPSTSTYINPFSLWHSSFKPTFANGEPIREEGRASFLVSAPRALIRHWKLAKAHFFLTRRRHQGHRQIRVCTSKNRSPNEGCSRPCRRMRRQASLGALVRSSPSLYIDVSRVDISRRQVGLPCLSPRPESQARRLRRSSLLPGRGTAQANEQGDVAAVEQGGEGRGQQFRGESVGEEGSEVLVNFGSCFICHQYAAYYVVKKVFQRLQITVDFVPASEERTSLRVKAERAVWSPRPSCPASSVQMGG